MRLNPVVVHLSRKAVTRTEVGDRKLDVDQIAAPSAYLAQRNPKYFPNPESFIPDRFLGSAPPKYSYFPFGLGHRTCFATEDRLLRKTASDAANESHPDDRDP
jgi:cytochrome P450